MRRLCLLLALAAATRLHGAEEKFSATVPAADFTAAGLAKLSPAEIERLDALVQAFRTGALERARREAAAAEARAQRAEARAAAAAAGREPANAAPDRSLLAKARVLLMPGTEIEYATVESRIAGEFRGWEGRTLFTLENGQRWQTTGSDSYVLPRPMLNPAVKISPGMLGSFWLTVEGLKARAKVTLVSSGAK